MLRSPGAILSPALLAIGIELILALAAFRALREKRAAAGSAVAISRPERSF